MSFEQPFEQYEKDPEVLLEDLKILLEKKQQMRDALRVAEKLPTEEREALKVEIESSARETKEELEKTNENIKSVFDRMMGAFELGVAPKEKLEEVTTRFLRASDANEALEALRMLEEFLPHEQKLAA